MVSGSIRFMTTVRGFLRSVGVTETPALRNYVGKFLRNKDLESDWLLHTREGEWCDEHLMMGALSEMTFQFGTLIATPVLVQLVKRAINATTVDQRRNIIGSIRGKIEKHFADQENACFIVPITVQNHWGVIVARVRGKKGNVAWGDGLNWKRLFTPYIETVHDVMSGLERFRSYDWTYAPDNLMTKECGFEKQKDNMSCGFYVIATVASLLAVDIGCISGYGYKPNYDKSISELIRRSCVKAFFKRVEEAYQAYAKQMPEGTEYAGYRYLERFSDWEVTRYIQLQKYGYVPQNDDAEIKKRHVKWNAPDIANGMTIEDPEKFLEELRNEGEVFKYPRRTTKKQEKGSKVTIRYRCMCYRNEYQCKAAIAIYRIDDGSTVQFKAKKFQTHNHPISNAK